MGLTRGDFVLYGASSRLTSIRELSTYAKWHSGYEVIPELSRKDGDVSILLVIKKMRYLTPVDDPLFSAHRRVDVLISSLTNTTRSEYTSDDMATGIACLAQVS